MTTQNLAVLLAGQDSWNQQKLQDEEDRVNIVAAVFYTVGSMLPVFI